MTEIAVDLLVSVYPFKLSVGLLGVTLSSLNTGDDDEPQLNLDFKTGLPRVSPTGPGSCLKA